MCAGRQTRAGEESRVKRYLGHQGDVNAIHDEIVLLILWLLGLVTSTAIGGFIHILLVIAIVVVLLQVISGRR